MNTALLPPSLYTQFKKRLFRFARMLQGTPKPFRLTSAVVGHETIARKNATLKMTVAIHNQGPGHCMQKTTFKVDWCPERQPGRVVHTSVVTIPAHVLFGQTETLELAVPCPPFLGRFQLATWIEGQSPAALLTPIEVIARSEDDIDYVAVYKNTDLNQNDWHVVGPSTQAEHERLANLKLVQLQELGLTPSMAIFDVGCGTGQLAKSLEKYLTKDGYYFGCDIGLEGIEHCRKHFLRPNFEFAVSGMTTLPPSSRTFEVITLFSVFTHTLADETMMLLHEMKPYLKPSGQIICDFYISDFVDRYSGNRGRIEFERSYLERIIALAGYEITIVDAWQVEPHTSRELLQLRRSR